MRAGFTQASRIPDIFEHNFDFQVPTSHMKRKEDK